MYDLRLTIRLWTLTFIIGLSIAQPIVRNNVVFIPVNKFSATQSTWTMSFVLDLQPYDDFLNTLRADLTITENLATSMTNKYLPTNAYKFLDLYLSSIQGLNAEIQKLYSVYIQLLHKVNSNKFIRQKRSLFDFGSDILRAVFGVAKDS